MTEHVGRIVLDGPIIVLHMFLAGCCASAQEPLRFGRNGVMWTGGRAEDEWEELLMDGKRSPFLLLYSWRLLGRPYLLLIRYGAVSSTPVMGFEMVALRSCEAREMIYPHTDTHTDTQVCDTTVCLCVCQTSRITSTSLTAPTSDRLNTLEPRNRKLRKPN